MMWLYPWSLGSDMKMLKNQINRQNFIFPDLRVACFAAVAQRHIKQADTQQNTCLQSHLSGNDIQSPFNFPWTEQSFEFALTFRRSCFLWTHLKLFLICWNNSQQILLFWQNCESLHPKECSEAIVWLNPLNCNLNRHDLVEEPFICFTTYLFLNTRKKNKLSTESTCFRTELVSFIYFNTNLRSMEFFP